MPDCRAGRRKQRLGTYGALATFDWKGTLMGRRFPPDRCVAAAVLSLVALPAAAAAQMLSAGQSQVVTMGGAELKWPSRDPHVAYDTDLSAEHMWVRLPKSAAKDGRVGLVVFVDPEDQVEATPPGWEAVLDRNHLIFVVPQGAGNSRATDRRCGLAVAAALRLVAFGRVDPARVYAAGLSGGARMAGDLGFYQPDVFHGTIQCCGADFPHAVPQVAPRDAEHAADAEYGHMPATEEEMAAAKVNVRFALVTGSRDFRHGFIVDLFHGGFEKEGFQADLIDVPGMPHTTASGPRFQEALDFIERRQPAVARVIAPPPALAPWASRPTDQWPQLLWENSFKSAEEQFDGASAFLMQLPTGQVVGVTARHVFGDTLDVAALEKPKTVYALFPHGKPHGTVRMRKVAWDPTAMAGDKPLDCVMMTADVESHYPAEVLKPRQTPPVVGETVYLLGVPYEDKAAQHVYKGVVTSEDGDESMFGYEFEGTPETRGFSGAPVIDANGLVLGIHHGKYDQQPDAGHLRAAAVDINAVLAAARPPPGSAARPAEVSRVKAGTAAPPASPSDAEVAAGHALDMAQNYVVLKRYDLARSKLQAITAKYPGTAAAKKAQQQLASLPSP